MNKDRTWIFLVSLLIAVLIMSLFWEFRAQAYTPIVAAKYEFAEVPHDDIVIESDTLLTEPEPEIEEIPEEPALLYLGSFRTTGYCNCKKCCGKWSGGPTAYGTMPQSQHTVAVDPSVIKLGTHLMINGIEYVAEDTGSGVDGKHIDFYYDDHSTALAHGLQYMDVYMIQ